MSVHTHIQATFTVSEDISGLPNLNTVPMSELCFLFISFVPSFIPIFV
jgi:hypothetical protein